MGFEIERCMVVEDSPIGLQAAANCGAVAVYLNRYGDAVEYDNVIEISSMQELPELVSKL
jgi:beta-phosphoglucomutase-like phosphatase (HAD superfamily)